MTVNNEGCSLPGILCEIGVQVRAALINYFLEVHGKKSCGVRFSDRSNWILLRTQLCPTAFWPLLRVTSCCWILTGEITVRNAISSSCASIQLRYGNYQSPTPPLNDQKFKSNSLISDSKMVSLNQWIDSVDVWRCCSSAFCTLYRLVIFINLKAIASFWMAGRRLKNDLLFS